VKLNPNCRDKSSVPKFLNVVQEKDGENQSVDRVRKEELQRVKGESNTEYVLG
jgi:hypothetical protein